MRPSPPPGARNWVLLILDSCRYDSFVEAAPPIMSSLGVVERRWSYATWTSPAHFNLLMGLLPHAAPTQSFASAVYQHAFHEHRHRLGVPDVSFSGMLPHLWLPTLLRDKLGYSTGALTSLPVLNPATPLNQGFDVFEQGERHNDLGALVKRLHFDGDRPWFWLINTGETHYPYAPADEPEAEWPRLPGMHGVFARLSGGRPTHKDEAPEFFAPEQLERLRQRQVEAVRQVDHAAGQMLAKCPVGTWVTITSDHGECFGEGGWFGHGPIPHEKVLEVPFVEGMVRRPDT